jgi:hypothetical protein
MARDAVTVVAPVDAYLADVGHRLRGPRRRREQILAELRDGLELAVDEQAPSADAAGQAIARFGGADVVARAFAGELATAWARRAIAWYVATGPLVGVWWLLLFHALPWRTGAIALVVAIPALPLVVLAIATALGTFAATGRLMRWLPEAGPHRALAFVMVIALLVVAGDLTMVVAFARSDLAATSVAVIAVTASLVRIACGLVVVRRVVAVRRTTVTDHPAEDSDGHA